MFVCDLCWLKIEKDLRKGAKEGERERVSIFLDCSLSRLKFDSLEQVAKTHFPSRLRSPLLAPGNSSESGRPCLPDNHT